MNTTPRMSGEGFHAEAGAQTALRTVTQFPATPRTSASAAIRSTRPAASAMPSALTPAPSTAPVGLPAAARGGAPAGCRGSDRTHD